MKMNGSGRFPFVLLVIINFLLNSATNAGVVKRSIRMVREVYPPDIEPENEGNQPQVCIVGDVVYGAEETVPAEQPCLKCRCQPPGVQCETVQCAKKPGCKAIQRSNKCCPDYQCECEHNGKIYANGEKLETNPGGECKVCYCRGGEVQCAEVSCYIRNDCEGKRVPGTCCPRYDHCPPIDAVPDRSSIITEPPLNTLKPIILELWQEPNATEVPSLPTINSIPEESNKVPDTSDLATVAPAFEEIPRKEESLHPRITIQEIGPERKEIPITAPPKIFISEPQGTLLIEEALPTGENTSNDLNIDSEPESSEVSEVFQHPPPVLRIGDKLLFLKKGNLIPEKDTTTADSIITIIGAEGLQRGGVEESLEVHEVKIEPETDIQEIKIEDDERETQNYTDNGPEVNDPSNLTKEVEDSSINSETNDLELKPAESTHILSLVKRKDQTLTTTSTTQAPTTAKEDVLTTLTSSIEEPRRSELPHQSTESTVEAETTLVPSPSETNLSTTILPSTEVRTEVQTKNTEPAVEQNPAYPPLPDIMPAVGDVSHKFEVELENDNSTTMEIKILPEVFDFLGNNTNNQTHSEWLKSSEVQTQNNSLVDFKEAKLPEELLNQRSPIDEDEENSTDVAEDTTTVKINLNEPNENFRLIKEIIAGNSDVEVTTGKNDEVQLIAEVKISDGNMESPTEPPSIITIASVVSEPLKEFSLNKTATTDEIKEDNIIGDALKESAMAPPQEPNASGDAEASVNPTSTESSSIIPKSIESLEIDSGEQTTPKTNHSSMVSNENASVETIQKEESQSETSDMTRTFEKEGSIELGSVEISDNSPESVLKDVEMVNATQRSVHATTEAATNLMKQDVELITVNNPKPTKLAKVETSTYELLPTPEETKSKTIIKREVRSGNPQEDIFRDLERELNAESSQSSKSPEEERLEADQIFRDLLDESQGVAEAKPRSKEQEKIDSISNALAGIALKGKAPDANVFRLVRGLFGGQRE